MVFGALVATQRPRIVRQFYPLINIAKQCSCHAFLSDTTVIGSRAFGFLVVENVHSCE